MNHKKFPKIISLNIIMLIFFLSIIELALGKWRENFLGKSNYVQIPNLIKDKSLKFDVRRLYDLQKPVIIDYERDEFGYRSRDKISNKPIVLTIGGSTTDELYVTEGETWQDILDIKLEKYDFINGGVSGQSSYGHFKSISRWHSKYLDQNKVSAIIFYIGVNDRRILNNKSSDWDFAQSKINYLKNLFKDNSFFTSQFTILKNKIAFYLNSKGIKNDLLNSYSMRTKEFQKTGIRYQLTENLNLKNYQNYKEIFSSLILEARNNFPDSKILIIQQQIPGCKFSSKTIVYDRHPFLDSNYCFDLLKVYHLQEKILTESLIQKNIKLFPMYLNDIIKDDEVYDYVHTNKKGSKSIAGYIASIMRNK